MLEILYHYTRNIKVFMLALILAATWNSEISGFMNVALSMILSTIKFICSMFMVGIITIIALEESRSVFVRIMSDVLAAMISKIDTSKVLEFAQSFDLGVRNFREVFDKTSPKRAVLEDGFLKIPFNFGDKNWTFHAEYKELTAVQKRRLENKGFVVERNGKILKFDNHHPCLPLALHPEDDKNKSKSESKEVTDVD